MTQGKLVTMLVLVSVICLSLAAILVPERERVGAEGIVDLVGMQPSEVASIEISGREGAGRLVRTGAGGWVVEFAEVGEGVRWPAAESRVRGFLRILDRLAGVEVEGDAEAWQGGPTVTLIGAGGARETVEVSAASLGGRSGIRRGNRAYSAPDELFRLVGAGVASWIDERAFAPVEGQVTDVRAVSGGETMSLARVGGGWQIAAPFTTGAEAPLVEELLRSLQAMPVASMSPLDDPARDAETAPDATVISIGSEVRSSAGGDVRTNAFRTALTAHAREGAAGQVAVVLDSIGAGGERRFGPMRGNIDGAALESSVRAPEFYIARRALDASAADVESIEIRLEGAGSFRWVRTADGWAAEGPGAAGAGLNDVVEFVTTRPAAQCVWLGSSSPEQMQPLAEIECFGLGGISLGAVTVGAGPLPGAPEQGVPYAMLVGDDVARYYDPKGSVETVRWIAGLRSAP